ncbi:MAG: hypothetical protein DYH06_19365, partial [Acidobacteria bacterium ACB2]|nr:hypothetical protein [Acidobacteria bacterium ACB2]
AVVTTSGRRIDYDFLIVATGLKLDYTAIEGMDASLIGKEGIASIYAGPNEAAASAHPSNPKGIANWLLSELLATMPDSDRQAGRVPLAPGALAALVARIDDGTISGKIAKELLPAMLGTGKGVDELVEEKGLRQLSDEGAVRAVVEAVVSASPRQAADYRGGKAATFGWFVGQVMKATGGRANPALVNRLLREVLGAP